MAVATERMERMEVYDRPAARFSWSAIFGGVFVALGVWILLYAFGMAVGLTALTPENPASAKGAGMWIAWWSLIAPIIAMFLGGVVAARSAGIITRVSGMLHGAVLWGLAIVVALVVFGSAMLSALSGVVATGGKMLGAAGQAAGMSQQTGQAGAPGMNTDAVLGPLNERLQSEGKPTITPQEFNAALSDVWRSAVSQGRLDRQQVVSALTQNTKLNQQDAEELAGRLETQFNQGAAQVQQGVFRAADITAAAMWGLTISMVLQLAAAMLGAGIGVRRTHRYEERRPEAQRGPPIEVHP